MSQELTASASVLFAKGNVASNGLSKANSKFNVAGTHYTRGVFLVPTTANGTAIPLAGVTTAGGWFMIQNNDITNYIKIQNAVSGTVIMRLGPGEFACGRFDDSVTAPAAIANTAAVEIEYIIVDK